jgi:phosphoribosyl 1,2-cyclic phosphodiesterase
VLRIFHLLISSEPFISDPAQSAIFSMVKEIVHMTDKMPSAEKLQAEPDYNLAVCILASGSKGNATFVASGSTSILVDAGLTGIEIERRLKSRGLCPEDLDAILVTHEHTDHIQGVGVLSRRYNLPIYINRKTQRAAASQLGISHDAEDPAGFTVDQNGMKIGIATDLGIATSMVKEHLKGCSLLILEANHDATMLTNGPYPWYLKQRIKGRTGHLSNEASKNILSEVQHDRLEHVTLAHLSEINNTPQKALSEVGPAMNHCNAQLDVAAQDECGALLRLKVTL